jgi:glycolate oxidase iron-sulfur subunit
MTSSSTHRKIVEIGRSNPVSPGRKPFYLKQLDFSVLQQCIHCGMCLPTCPTYDETHLERNSPRGRIALMRNIAEGHLDVTRAFGEELYFCLGCLTCETVCPAGVNYGLMFENARADIERAGVLDNPKRRFIRAIALRWIFTHPRLLRAFGRLLYFYQASGLQRLIRRMNLTALLPAQLRELEPLTPAIQRRFSDALIARVETPKQKQFRTALLTGCVQDLAYSNINRDTADVLLANHCEVITPRAQFCCGSLHAHNGELELSREMARKNIDTMESACGPLESLDAIITNAGGCGTHLKNYAHLLAGDAVYSKRAAIWSKKLRDIHEWLVEIGIRKPEETGAQQMRVTYHESCHLCHGQRISREPREILKSIPGLELIELPEASWCCGSAGIYNITQPEMSQKLLDRKMTAISKTGAAVVAAANPGCLVQLEAGARQAGILLEILHPVTLLARAYRADKHNG